MSKDLPDRSRVVIIGGGIAGCSLAYHLTKLGWNDVVLLEQNELTSGTTWHAAALVTQLHGSRVLTDIARYSVDLYPKLEAETGQSTGFKRTGRIQVARTKGRMEELRRAISMGKVFGVDIEEINLREASDMWPLMDTKGLEGAVFIPQDGQTNPIDTSKALAKGAIQRGAVILENVRVKAIYQDNGSVSSVSTNRGDIGCEVVVNCGGMWARQIGLMCGVSVPLHAAEHMYVVTKPMDGVYPDMPCLRDSDGYVYFRRDREDTNGLLMGGFEPVAKPWGMGGIPADYAYGRMEPDWDHFRILMDSAKIRVPAMETAEIDRFMGGPESFTPDNHYILGEAPELRNFFVAAGFNSGGISASAGAGKVLAEWIVEGKASMDLWDVDIRRFDQYQNNSRYLHDTTVELVGMLYMVHWPHRQMETARPVRLSPLHDRLISRGACFGVSSGWERPNWYAPEGVEPRYEYSYGRQNWFSYSSCEHRSVREDVGLFDQTSFAKFLLQGGDAESVLQRICANDIAVPEGRTVYTPMLNHAGGIECDLTVTCLSEGHYMIVTGAAVARHDFTWIKQNIPEQAKAFLTDVTSAYSVIGIMGPKSRQLLSSLTEADLSNNAFPFLASREIGLEYATVRATRITYVGELGWELYIPTEFTLAVYDSIVRKGTEFELRHVGFHALDSLRMEKAYRAWGKDITPRDTPLEAGISFGVASDKKVDFNGREAFLRQRELGLNRRLVIFTLDDPEPLILGDEPIYRNGKIVGLITSGSFGHTLGRSVCMGYVENHDGVNDGFIKEGTYEIEISAERFSASAGLRPPYDPNGLRVKG